MTVSDLIRELQSLPGHLPVALALDIGESEMVDIEGNLVTINVTKDCDCYSATYVEWMGSWARLVAEGPYYGKQPE